MGAKEEYKKLSVLNRKNGKRKLTKINANPVFPLQNMCCNCRNFPILYKLVSFTLAGIASHILTWFLCAVNTRFLTLLSELSLCLKYEALLKYCTNSLVKCRQTLSPTVVLVFPSHHSNSTLILGTWAQRWQNTVPSPAAVWPNSDHGKAIKDIWECLTIPRAARVRARSSGLSGWPLHRGYCRMWEH